MLMAFARQQLHADTDAEERGLLANDRLFQRRRNPGGAAQRGDALRERPHPRQHDAVGSGDARRVGGDFDVGGTGGGKCSRR